MKYQIVRNEFGDYLIRRTVLDGILSLFFDKYEYYGNNWTKNILYAATFTGEQRAKEALDIILNDIKNDEIRENISYRKTVIKDKIFEIEI